MCLCDVYCGLCVGLGLLGAQELFCCQGLRKLTLSDNDIATLPPAIAALVNLEFLDLSKNCMPREATIYSYTNLQSSAANQFVLNTDVWLISSHLLWL